jgi:proteic killer suppression protein
MVSSLLRRDRAGAIRHLFRARNHQDHQGVTLDVRRIFYYTAFMIVSFRDKETAAFAAGKRVKAFSGIERAARLKLDRLEAALTLSDLAVLPGNRFEALKGSRKGQDSIRVNDQWRVCFEWPERSPGPANVEIVDYH